LDGPESGGWSGASASATPLTQLSAKIIPNPIEPKTLTHCVTSHDRMMNLQSVLFYFFDVSKCYFLAGRSGEFFICTWVGRKSFTVLTKRGQVNDLPSFYMMLDYFKI
jgi:hypothetical protein